MPSGNAREAEPVSRLPQRERGRARVAALMGAAAALFAEKGFDATTMTEIAAHAGASIGSLYLFFPTKQVLAQAMLTAISEALSGRLDGLRDRVAGWPAAEIGDALFDELSAFLADNPVYAALIDMRGDDGWRHAIRARRRQQIEALFAQATPALRPGQAELLSVIVPELMKVSMVLSHRAGVPPHGALLAELRAMLRHHLTPRATPGGERGTSAGRIRPA